MDVSIVSGTFNRLNSLQRMVDSVRKSVSNFYGLSYQIVLVDGGSTDGTQAWCKSQSDIFLIEHEKLLGAVKAFNDGAYASEGLYCILANDDIEFVEDSITVAYLYMQSNPECGVGCFFQDRERQHYPDTDPSKFYVAEMPCVEDNRQVWRPYGQVCIVPRWLGNHLSWWGTYLHTYGGDNELSSKVYEMGYKVSPIPGAKISDHEVQDGLRHVNNFGHGIDPKRTGGYHPDSKAWGTHWQFRDRRDRVTGQVLTGPTIQHVPQIEGPTIPRKDKILYLPIYEQGWAIQKEQKRGLREALAKVALVAEYDYIQRNSDLSKKGMLAELKELIKKVQPSFILTQIHNGEIINHEDIIDIKRFYPHINIINWNGDYWPENLLSQSGIALARSFDLQLVVNRDALEKYQELGVNAQYWQIGFEPDGIGCQSDMVYDVTFLASGYSAKRQEFVKQLRSLNINFALWGSGWPQGWAKGQNLYDFKSACKCYREAKISIGDSQWPETGFVSNRVFQALAAGGSVLAHQYFRDMDKLGLIDGETCIIWRDFDELKQKISYYLANEDERQMIAKAGEILALEKHSFDVRVRELFDMVTVGYHQAEEEGWR